MITYPLDIPAAPGFRKITFVADSVVAVTQSPFTLRQQTHAWPGQRWTMTAELPPMRGDTAAEWLAFFTALNGREGTFRAGDSAFRLIPSSRALGTPAVKTAVTARTATIDTKGWTPDTDILKPGDWLEIGGRLRRVLQAASSDANGDASITVWPYIAPLAADSPIEWEEPKGTWRLDQFPSMTMDVNRIQSGFTFTATEVF